MLSRLHSILRAGERWPGRGTRRVALMAPRPDRLWRKRPPSSSADYFVFLGESGAVISPTDQPAVFVHVCCLVERVAYRRDVVPALEHAKQHWFGRTDVRLHPGVFGTAMHPCLPLASIAARRAFAADFDALLTTLPFRQLPWRCSRQRDGRIRIVPNMCMTLPYPRGCHAYVGFRSGRINRRRDR